MEYDLARARNVDAAPLAITVQVHGTAFSPYVAYVGPTVAYGMDGSTLGTICSAVVYVATLSIVRPSVRSVPP
eukprot:scaffold6006_cov35-Attheya_sp.AAC.1